MPSPESLDAERQRLAEADDGSVAWRQWGPYLSERQWGTVREDYSANGDAWGSFPHEHARSRAYRWGEDGLLGICDDEGRLCFALALWNGVDPYLKERLFGLSGPQGNHGEDVKEEFLYLDNTPTHSYMRALYRYPQRAFPYDQLVSENARRNRSQPEFELADTNIFADDRFWDVTIEYAKASFDDLVIRISALNRGPDPATLHILPTAWFHNTWAWGYPDHQPSIERDAPDGAVFHLDHPEIGDYWLACNGSPELLFTGNETNFARLWNGKNETPFVKDGINDAIVSGAKSVNPAEQGTKAAAHYLLSAPSGGSASVLLRLSHARIDDPFDDAEAVIAARESEANAFYARLRHPGTSDDAALVQRRAFAGLLWTKQWYSYDVRTWLEGDPAGPTPPAERWHGRNAGWQHLTNGDVIIMPDAWEYPWYAAWDLAFHCITVALVDPEFAKAQLLLLLQVWYMHPKGQLPAYEWAFDNVNPPVQAWAALQVYRIAAHIQGHTDRPFLERAFSKLLLTFTWWVNREDVRGDNVFAGGFLGLDNIGIFDRDQPPGGESLEQADGTAWVGMFCLNMLAIALELARDDPVYEDMATKFFEHFLYIAGAMNNIGQSGISLWDDTDEFFYDVIQGQDGNATRLRIRSFVGLIPLFAVETIDEAMLKRLPAFSARMAWFLRYRPALAALVPSWDEPGAGSRRLLALVHGHRMKALLRRALDPDEFLSDFGIRSLSRYHAAHPYVMRLGGTTYQVDYEPAESTTPLFGGNSNWRGPVWFPLNYLLIEALRRFHHYYSDDFVVECPVGSGQMVSLEEAAHQLGERLTSLFLPGQNGHRPFMGSTSPSETHRPDEIVFHEYFHGDTGKGLGASHQTGWTALVAKLIDEAGRRA